MYSKTTNSIAISVMLKYEDEQSMPSENYHVWEYHVHIKNARKGEVQLLNRRWVIVDDKGQIHKTEGAGVVGVQPLLKPGEEFEYSSHVHLNTYSAVMMGKYEIITEEKELLKVDVPSFSLDCPYVKKAMN